MNAVIVNTRNRRDLTGITLDSIRRNKRKETIIYILDDYSSEYPTDWLMEWGKVFRPPETMQSMPDDYRVGRMAWERLLLADTLPPEVSSVFMFDNDLLVCEGFEEKFENLLSKYDPCIVAGLSNPDTWIAKGEAEDAWFMDTISGCALAMKRPVIKRLLAGMSTVCWDKLWDHKLGAVVERLVMPQRSIVLHLGVYGGSVNTHQKGYMGAFFEGDPVFSGNGGRRA